MADSSASTTGTGTALGPFTLSIPIGVGTLQWGTTLLDRVMVGRILDATACRRIFSRLTTGGVQFFDTAEGYGGGTSEIRLGAVMRATGARNVVVATKFLPTWWRYSKKALLRAARGSAARLGVPSIDLYFLHTPVHLMPVEHWVDAACDAADAGIINAIGLSNCNAQQVERAHAAAKRRGRSIAANQIMFSLLCANSPALKETVATCKRLNIAVVAFTPIGQGLLTDNLTPASYASNRAAKVTGISWDQLTALRETVRRISVAQGVTMAQVALAWVVAKGCIPLVGCRSETQAADTLGFTRVNLSEEDVKALDAVALSRSTFESPRWRRGFFSFLFGGVMLVSRLLMLLTQASSIAAAVPPE